MSLHPMGKHFDCETNLLSYIKQFSSVLVVNEMEIIRSYCQNRLNHNKSKLLSVAIILDNFGPELLADLCLAEYLIQSGLFGSVWFYGKSIPWFVSDVTQSDFDWLLENINSSHSLNDVSKIISKNWSQIWLERVKNGTFVFRTHEFWTMPFEYDKMVLESPDLYKELSTNFDLILFKVSVNVIF